MDWDDGVSASPRTKGSASTSSDAAVPAAVALDAVALTGSAFALGRRRSAGSSHSEIS